jgi:hypothetical protein
MSYDLTVFYISVTLINKTTCLNIIKNPRTSFGVFGGHGSLEVAHIPFLLFFYYLIASSGIRAKVDCFLQQSPIHTITMSFWNEEEQARLDKIWSKSLTWKEESSKRKEARFYSMNVNACYQTISFPWLVFGEKVKVNIVFICDSTGVSDSILILFGGALGHGVQARHLKRLEGQRLFFAKPEFFLGDKEDVRGEG